MTAAETERVLSRAPLTARCETCRHLKFLHSEDDPVVQVVFDECGKPHKVMPPPRGTCLAMPCRCVRDDFDQWSGWHRPTSDAVSA
jgi:hypothetical protein